MREHIVNQEVAARAEGATRRRGRPQSGGEFKVGRACCLGRTDLQSLLVLVRRARPLCRVHLPLGFGDHVLNCVLLRKSGLDLSGFPQAAIAALVSFLPFHSMMPRFINCCSAISPGVWTKCRSCIRSLGVFEGIAG